MATNDGDVHVVGYREVQQVLSDERLEVPPPGPIGPVGSVSWLRGSVSRFANGSTHAQRRARVEAELTGLDPDWLRTSAHQRASQELAMAAGSDDTADTMARLANRVPVAILAAGLSIADPDAATDAVITVAAGYFPGCTAATEQAADAATARLLDLLGSRRPDLAIAQIAILVQACAATAGLISTSLQALNAAGDTAREWPTDDVLREVLRHDPPARASRRIAAAPIDLAGRQVTPGDVVICDIVAANRDPAIYESPDEFDPARREAPSLTFGHGVRPCPGQPHALALAAGVIDAVRERAAA